MKRLIPLVLLVILLVAGYRWLLGGDGAREAATAPGGDDAPVALSILAGSELKDLDFLHAEMEQVVGGRIRWTYSGTLDMVDAVAAPTPPADLLWAASNRYLTLAAPGKVKASEKIMLSPVILGVKRSAASALGWDRTDPTWAEVAAAAKAGKFRYGMTNPTASNSGFCAAIGVAAALSGKSDGLSAADIPTEALREFFSGQKLVSGSSGWLADAYAKDPSALDGLINYESVVLSLNAGGALKEPLTAVYPKEGIITADYPLMLLQPAQRAAYDKLVAFMKRDDVQRRLVQQTHRRPVAPGVALSAEFGTRLLIELPFPGTLDALDALLVAWQDELRRPGHSWFVLDTSGSMQGDRIMELREGLMVLASDAGGRFTRFNLREKVDLLPFASSTKQGLALDFGDRESAAKGRETYKAFVGALEADGGTAIYDALLASYRQIGEARRAEPDRYYSIVLMTDGQNTDGTNFEAFREAWNALGDEKSARVFPILFGDSDAEQMKALAELTGGKTFDGRKDSLARVFKEIRGYQ